jgi:hypothetical protein
MIPNFTKLLEVGTKGQIMDKCYQCKRDFCKYGVLGDPEQNIELSHDGPNGPTPLNEMCIPSITDPDQYGLKKICKLGECAKDPKVFCGMECLDEHCPECEECTFNERFHKREKPAKENCCENCETELKEHEAWEKAKEERKTKKKSQK